MKPIDLFLDGGNDGDAAIEDFLDHLDKQSFNKWLQDKIFVVLDKTFIISAVILGLKIHHLSVFRALLYWNFFPYYFEFPLKCYLYNQLGFIEYFFLSNCRI